MKFIVKLQIVSLVFLGSSLFTVALFAGQFDQLESDPGQRVENTEFSDPVSSNTLDALSGGQDMQIDNIDMLVSNMNLKAQMEKNVLYSTSTGANTVSNGAFSNANGISTVIQNSGNQVIINNALILNLQIE